MTDSWRVFLSLCILLFCTLVHGGVNYPFPNYFLFSITHSVLALMYFVTLSLIQSFFSVLFASFVHFQCFLCSFRSFSFIDAHGLKIQGRGYGMFLPKFLGGGQGFQEKLPGGVHLFCVLLYFY